MTSLYCLVFILLITNTTPSDYTFTPYRLSDDIIVFEENYWEGHLTVVSTGEGLVIVDTFPSLRLARDARRYIEDSYPNQPFRYVIYTDCHWDHNAGNQVFPEAIIIGHAKSVEKMRIDIKSATEWFRDDSEKKRKELESLDAGSSESKKLLHESKCEEQLAADLLEYVYTPPDITLDGGATIRLGDKTFDILYFGPAHTDSDFAVFIPEERLLITGDLVFNRGAALIDIGMGGDALNYMAAVEKLIRIGDRARRVVPGHGQLGDVQCVVEFHTYLKDVLNSVRNARQKGLSLDQAKAGIKMTKYSHYMWHSEDVIARSVEAFWRSLDSSEPGTN